MDIPAPDPVNGMASIAVPGAQTKCAFAFASGAIKLGQPTGQFVTGDQHPGGVLGHGLVERLKRGVVDDESPSRWRVEFTIRAGGRRCTCFFCAFLNCSFQTDTRKSYCSFSLA